MEVMTFQVRPNCAITNLLPDKRCVAILIDLVSNVFQVAQLRPELRYWQKRVVAETADAGQIGYFLSRLIEAVEQMYFEAEEKARIPFSLFLDPPPGAVLPKGSPHIICGAALRCGHAIAQHYITRWKNPQPEWPNPRPEWIGGLVDVHGQLYRPLRLLPHLRTWKQQLAQGSLTVQNVADVFKYIGIQLTYLPSYMVGEEERRIVSA